MIRILRTGEYQRRSRELGAHLHARLAELVGSGAAAVRGRGLWAGIDLDAERTTARAASEALLRRGVLCKETQDSTLRLAPPLVIDHADLDSGLDAVTAALRGE